MTRRPISANERYGLWSVWGGRCYWCREPLYFEGSQVDHVIALEAVSTAEGETLTRKRYGLGEEHDFDDFENFVPAHSNCNRRKWYTLYDPIPAFITYIDQAKSKSDEARTIARRMEEGPRLASVIATVETITRNDNLTEGELSEFYAKIAQEFERIGISNPLSAADSGQIETHQEMVVGRNDISDDISDDFDSPLSPDEINSNRPTLNSIMDNMTEFDRDIRSRIMGYCSWFYPCEKKYMIQLLDERGFGEEIVNAQMEQLQTHDLVTLSLIHISEPTRPY